MSSSLKNAEGGDEADSQRPKTRALVSLVYKCVWEDFLVWEQDHCQNTLRSLSRPVPPPSLPSFSSVRSQSVLKPLSRLNAPSTIVESFDDWDVANGSKTTIYLTNVQTIKQNQILQPPSYEACTPISRNLMVGDDSDFLPFIPNSDDSTYDYNYDVDEHKYFSWHQPYRDPDCIVFDSSRSIISFLIVCFSRGH